MTKYTQKQLDDALNTVVAELSDLVRADTASLTKSAEDDAPSEESQGSSPPSASADGLAEESAPPSDGPPAEASAPADAPPAADGPPAGPEASAAPEGDPAVAGDQGPQTVEELMPLYAQMGQSNPELLKAHYLAVRGAMEQLMGQGPGPEASAPPAGPPGPPPAAPPQAPAPMAMSEKKLVKSEAEQKVEVLEQSVVHLTKAFEKLLTPVRKSVKGVSDLKFIGRTEEEKPSTTASLTKSEVREILREKIREGKLSKKDKDLIQAYTVGSVNISKIEHLLVAK